MSDRSVLTGAVDAAGQPATSELRRQLELRKQRLARIAAAAVPQHNAEPTYMGAPLADTSVHPEDPWLTRRPLPLDQVRRGEMVPVVQQVVCEHFKVDRSDLLARTRKGNASRARHVAWLLCSDVLGLSDSRIADRFDRDHTSVLIALRNLRADLKNDEQLRGTIDRIRARIEAAV